MALKFVKKLADPKLIKKLTDDVVQPVSKQTDEALEESFFKIKDDVASPEIKQTDQMLYKDEKISNVEYDKRIKELDKAKDVETWQAEAKKLVKNERLINPEIKTPELKISAKNLIENKITRKEHLANVDKYKPVSSWDNLPREPSDKALVYALDADKREKGLFVLAKEIAEDLKVKISSLKIGDIFNGRLDIPAYTRHDTWIISGTSPNVRTKEGGGVTNYAKAVHYGGKEKPVKFIASQKSSEKIGTGEVKKFPYATISGVVKDLDVNRIRQKAIKYLNDPEWTQAGFDPRRQSSLYVRSGENKHVPIREGSEVIQIGPLVLVKNAKLDFAHTGYDTGGDVKRESVSDVVNSIKLEYPIFKNIEVSDKRNEGMSDNRQLEYYSEKDSPTGKERVEIFNPNLQGEELKNAIFGDMLHSAPSKSKEYADKKLQLINSRTPKQIEIDNKAYEIAIKQGEKRPFDKWYAVSRSDAFIRGYLAKQWEDSYYTEEQKKLMDSMLQTLKNKSEMAKGGAMLNQQMEMAFMSKGGSFPDLTGDGKVTKKNILRGRGIEGFQEGGLQDEGGTVDPVSGNDVPSGSMKEEVRDDVPAMLSEGEFVFPADVVRYIGLSKLMEMRQQAKMGLKIMEEMGQMGNSEEATLPDDFGIPDIEIIEDDDDDDDDAPEMAQGGVIYAQEGTDVSASVVNRPSVNNNQELKNQQANVIGNTLGQLAGFGGGTGTQENSGFMSHMYFYNTDTGLYRILPAGMVGRMQGDTEITEEEYRKAIGNKLANERIQEANKVYENIPQPKPKKDETQSKEPASEKNYYTDEYGMPMLPTPPDGVKIPPQQPQQTDFERMMGYGAGQGSNPYGPSRVPYTKEDGTVVNVLEDYMGRPMEDTDGLTRVNPYEAGPVFGGDTPAGGGGVDPVVPPTPPTPEDTTPKRKDRDAFYGKDADSTGRKTSGKLTYRDPRTGKLIKDDRSEGKKRYDALQAQIDKDIEDLKAAGDSRFVGKTDKEARDAYYGLNPSERFGMAKEDLSSRDFTGELLEQIKSIPEEFAKSPKVLTEVAKKFNMAKRVGLDRLKGGYKEEQKEREKRKAKFEEASKSGKKYKIKSSGDSAADRRRQKEVDKKDKEIKDRLKEASKTGSLRLKKGGLMKRNYP